MPSGTVVHGRVSKDFIALFFFLVVTPFLVIIPGLGILVADPLWAPERMQFVLLGRLVVVSVEGDVAIIAVPPRERESPGQEARSPRSRHVVDGMASSAESSSDDGSPSRRLLVQRLKVVALENGSFGRRGHA
jgi:hypothetical protein